MNLTVSATLASSARASSPRLRRSWRSSWPSTSNATRAATPCSSTFSRASCRRGRGASRPWQPRPPRRRPPTRRTVRALGKLSSEPPGARAHARATPARPRIHPEELLTLADFSFGLTPSLDNINFFAVCEYLEKTHLAQRVRLGLNSEQVGRWGPDTIQRRHGAPRRRSLRRLWNDPSARRAASTPSPSTAPVGRWRAVGHTGTMGMDTDRVVARRRGRQRTPSSVRTRVRARPCTRSRRS